MKWSFQKMPIIRLPRDAEIPLEPLLPILANRENAINSVLRGKKGGGL
jgi:hypothetical protein